MQASGVPVKFPIPFANSAGGSFKRAIPVSSQIGIQQGAASLTDGFPPLNFQPIASGGVPPFGADVNGILFEISAWSQWQQVGGPIVYDATQQASVGGYPEGAIVQSAIVPGKQWLSTTDNNTTSPDAFGAGWVTPPGMMPSGTPIPSFSSTVLPGCVLANGLSIGNAASGASTASPQMFFLFCAVWLQFSQSECPVRSGGTIVARGANPIADFAANRTIDTPPMQGSGVKGVDTMGGTVTALLSGVPVQTGGTTIPGSLVGENLHTLTTTELAAHTHSNSLNDPGHLHSSNNFFQTGSSGGVGGGGAFGSNLTANTSTNGTGVTLTNASQGGGAAHNNVDRDYLVYWNLVL